MPPIILRWWGGNYLRVRGEYVTEPPSKIAVLELPPRARRIQPEAPAAEPEVGTTSACAENTTLEDMSLDAYENYLRVRGEYQQSLTFSPLF